ncbi:hypothetical protein AAE02nite_18240 [Adhaeribacter aerolatus]|uniref:BatD protein n=1 Tax=Adhaeribacter aerolatus TaxID=670289 RepID=A0A512AWW5_9BACT|nr:BatD family protein [Adhaeribacter aerolatus]GEO04160.1 hypothetical protein AAE02nite_18240 [Adhaeribacter aerolatus]
MKIRNIALFSGFLLLLQPFKQYAGVNIVKVREVQQELYRGNDAFLLCVPAKKQVFAGEPFTVNYKLLLSTSVKDAKVVSAPLFRGLSAEEINRPLNFKQEQFRGRNYRVKFLKQVVLTTDKPGKLILEPLTVLLNMELPPDPDDFFPVEKYQEYTLFSEPVQVNVLPLPNLKQSIAKAIGKFNINTSVEKSQVALGNSINYQINIAGRGNASNITPPDLDLPTQLEVYQPTITFDRKLTPKGPATNHLFKYKLVPNDTGNFVIPSLQFTYFDSEEGKYVTLSSAKHEIKVKGSKNSFSQAKTTLTNSIYQNTKNNTSLIIEGTTLYKRKIKFFGSFSFFIIILISFIFYGTAYAYSKYVQRIAANPLLQRKREAIKLAGYGLKSIKNDNSDVAYTQLSILILTYLSARLEMEKVISTTKEAKTMLLQRNIALPVVNQLQEVLSRCYEASYAQEARKDDIKQLCHKTEFILESIEKVTT